MPASDETADPDRGKLIARNRLNDLYSREWILFQKSWFVPRPAPRKTDVLLHPAKFPEELAADFIRFFTKRGQVVLDPMAGTGSALVAALENGRRAYGIELQPKYADIACERIGELCDRLDDPPRWRLETANAADIAELGFPTVDYCITSPPYWDMLRRQGHETQKQRRESDDLDVYYSDDAADLGNITDYDEFLSALAGIYRQVADTLRDSAYMTVIVKNVKKGGTIYPLAWDLARLMSEFLVLKDEKIWCQDDLRLSPYGMGSAWVSNTMHHYCLNFRKQ